MYPCNDGHTIYINGIHIILSIPYKYFFHFQVSILSAKILTDIHMVMHAVRNNSCPFGGVQVICGGDFMQPPPVSCAQYGHNGEFAFVSSVWRQTFHKVELTKECQDKECQGNNISLIGL